jgi:hypothetical protein
VSTLERVDTCFNIKNKKSLKINLKIKNFKKIEKRKEKEDGWLSHPLDWSGVVEPPHGKK